MKSRSELLFDLMNVSYCKTLSVPEAVSLNGGHKFRSDPHCAVFLFVERKLKAVDSTLYIRLWMFYTDSEFLNVYCDYAVFTDIISLSEPESDVYSFISRRVEGIVLLFRMIFWGYVY